MASTTDLQFTITFKDGSVWTDRFNRHFEMDKNCNLIPTTKFVNDFMQHADDLLSSKDVKDRFVEWWTASGRTDYTKITWKFVN